MPSRDSPLTPLEKQAHEQFDRLLDRSELFWNPSPEIEYQCTPFNVSRFQPNHPIPENQQPEEKRAKNDKPEIPSSKKHFRPTDFHCKPKQVFFRLSDSTSHKPYNPNDSSRRPGFLDPDPDFTLLEHVAPAHKLILNKFCWTRPQMILHTAEFASQTEPLSLADFAASREILVRLGCDDGDDDGGNSDSSSNGRWMVIFNGGPDAGSSVAHKHLQAVPQPNTWKMFPDVALAKDVQAQWVSEVPFDHRFQAFASIVETAPEQLYAIYQRLCGEMEIPETFAAHNIILTQTWLLVVPRQSSNIDGLCMAGANGMVGQLWLKSNQQLQHWKKLGPMNVLERFGVPAAFPSR